MLNTERALLGGHGSAYHQLLTSMLISHAAGCDICVYGGKGEGKTYLINLFAACLGYTGVSTMLLYADMSARDLLQHRTTTQQGETIWQDSPLVHAMQRGQLCVLDGLHRLPMGTISVLYQLVHERGMNICLLILHK